MVAEGESPPAAREDGDATIPKEDVHRPEEIWPALLPQGNLPGGRAGAYTTLQTASGSRRELKPRALTTARSSKKWDPRATRGPSIATARWRGVAATPFTGGARRSAARGGGPGRPPPPGGPDQCSPGCREQAPPPVVMSGLGRLHT
jgi:hypothetical protein